MYLLFYIILRILKVVFRLDQGMTVGQKLLNWLVFSVILALMPIVFNLLKSIVLVQEFAFVQLFSGGELLLVSMAVAAGGLGQLLSSKRLNSGPRILSVGGCIILSPVCAFVFSLTTSLTRTSSPRTMPTTSKRLRTNFPQLRMD